MHSAVIDICDHLFHRSLCCESKQSLASPVPTRGAMLGLTLLGAAAAAQSLQSQEWTNTKSGHVTTHTN